MLALFTVLFVFSITGFILAIFTPKTALWWESNPTRGRALMFYSVCAVIFLVLVSVIAPPESQKSLTENKESTTKVKPKENFNKEPPEQGDEKSGTEKEIDKGKTKESEKPKYLPRNTPAKSGAFYYEVNGAPRYKDRLGSEFYGEKASEDAIFLLVPVKVKNSTNETESLPSTITWKVVDLNKDYTYEVATMADLYLDSEDRLDSHRIPPGISRNGYIVFEIREDSRYNDLMLEVTSVFTKTLKFALNFKP